MDFNLDYFVDISDLPYSKGISLVVFYVVVSSLIYHLIISSNGLKNFVLG